MTKDIKNKIRLLVKEYIRNFPQEYELFKQAVAVKRSLQDKSTGALKGDHVLYRPLIEYPETLYGIINLGLTAEEKKEFDASEKGVSTGARWFAKEFPDFRIVDKI